MCQDQLGEELNTLHTVHTWACRYLDAEIARSSGDPVKESESSGQYSRLKGQKMVVLTRHFWEPYHLLAA